MYQITLPAGMRRWTVHLAGDAAVFVRAPLVEDYPLAQTLARVWDGHGLGLSERDVAGFTSALGEVVKTPTFWQAYRGAGRLPAQAWQEPHADPEDGFVYVSGPCECRRAASCAGALYSQFACRPGQETCTRGQKFSTWARIESRVRRARCVYADDEQRRRRVATDNDPFAAVSDGARPALLAELTANGPVHHRTLPTNVAAWVVTGYAEARAALADPRLIKGGSENAPFAKELPEQTAALQQHMLSQDPPVHTRLRKLVSMAFTRRRIESLAPRIEQICDRHLDSLAGKLGGGQQADLVTEYALPVPFIVICELLGIPSNDFDEFRDAWAVQAAGPIAGIEKFAESSTTLIAFLRKLLAAKRRDPGDDLLSALVAVRDDEGGLTEDELTSMAYVLLFAGHETTANLIASGVRALLLNPRQRALLNREPDRMAATVEEILRYDSPAQLNVPTIAAEPLEVGGRHIAAGEVVVVSLLGANHDPKRFPGAETFDITRATPHLAFGHGIHHCVGAPLARLEGTIALRALFDRLPGLELAVSPESLRREPSLLINKLVELPVRDAGSTFGGEPVR